MLVGDDQEEQGPALPRLALDPALPGLVFEAVQRLPCSPVSRASSRLAGQGCSADELACKPDHGKLLQLHPRQRPDLPNVPGHCPLIRVIFWCAVPQVCPGG